MQVPADKSKQARTNEVPGGWMGRTRRALAASAWAPLAGKALAYAIGFALLALVGSGTIARWLSPPGRLVVGVPVAEAAEPSARPAESPAPIATTLPDAGASPASDAGTAGVAPDGKVILNHATEQDLRRLPGVGPTRAKAILALREKKGGRFQRIEDLLRVRGIGRRTLARLRPLVRVD